MTFARRTNRQQVALGLSALTLSVCVVQGGRVYDSAHGVTCHW